MQKEHLKRALEFVLAEHYTSTIDNVKDGVAVALDKLVQMEEQSKVT